MRTTLVIELLAVPGAVRGVRRVLRRYLGDAGGAAQLCVSELLSNVILHVGEGAPVTVRVCGEGDGRVRIEVTDPDPYGMPVRRSAARDEEGGRGIALLAAVSLRWGVWSAAGCKTVWCEVGVAEGADGGEAPAGRKPPCHLPHRGDTGVPV
ncbi:ATP-binding protein [Streptomyces sp. NPDC050161]|uniref:ATP-binding protein n=1 Tax=Streptomyces sp. NPDC050161 TaxID=3365604 RepID=UPI0037B95196